MMTTNTIEGTVEKSKLQSIALLIIKKSTILFAVFLLCPVLKLRADEAKAGKEGRTMMIEPGDSMETIVAKAALVRPSERQVAWQELEFTAFIHFGVNTFTGNGWGDGKEDPNLFAPTNFDVEQWIRTFKAAGMKGVVVTAKHHDGMCMWQTETTEHSIKNSAWRGGKGDVLKAVADACRKEGLKFGVYLSPWDRNTTEFGTPGYHKIFQTQLRELLTRYGEVFEVWFDGAHAPKDKPEIFDWSAHFRLIRELQPGACIAVMGPDVRWCGNEGGGTRDAEWSVVALDNSDPRPAEASQETSEAYVKRLDPNPKDLGSREAIKNAKQLVWSPSEIDTSIRPEWFYNESENLRLRSLDQLIDLYYRSVGGNAVLLLNVPPDRRGLIYEADTRVLEQMGKILRETFAVNLAQGASPKASAQTNEHPASTLVDGDPLTYWTTPQGVTTATIEFDLGQNKKFNVAMMQEFIREGQVIEGIALDVKEGDAWREIAKAFVVGHKRLMRFDEVTAQHVRLRVTQARANPTLSNFGLFLAPTVLSAPTLVRSKQGVLTLTAQPGVAIHYTLDGSAPTSQSPRYEKPFDLSRGGMVRAISIPIEKVMDAGVEAQSAREFGIMPSKWRVVSVNGSQESLGLATRAIDDNPDSAWRSPSTKTTKFPHELVIDFNESLDLRAFTYTPPQGRVKRSGTVETFEVYVSEDGTSWGEPVAAGTFDNIHNNPIQRKIDIQKPAKGRYFRFVALSSADATKYASAAEIGVMVK